MRDYGVIYCKIWTDHKFRNFSDSEKMLFVYLLTCEHSNLIGCYRLTFAYIADDLNWDIQKVKNTMSTLCKHGVAMYDPSLFWVFIRRYLKYNPLKNGSCGISARKLFETVPRECAFYTDFLGIFKENPRHMPADLLKEIDTVLTQCQHQPDYSTSTSTSTSNISSTKVLDVPKAETESPPAEEPEESAETKAPTKTPPCPHQEIIAAYHEALPMCPRMRDWHETRESYLRARWRENPERQKLQWWKEFFKYIADSPFLTGKTGGRDGKPPFLADLEWLIKPTNFTKVIEGKYHRD